ncbi:conserved hypothetical protein [delta proteobacterium NaphS2]|nr:conserved hypothetical protein [delta proteobacterium NaphS2]
MSGCYAKGPAFSIFMKFKGLKVRKFRMNLNFHEIQRSQGRSMGAY